MSCRELALGSALPLAGTATRAERWLLVEARAAWGRDAVVDTDLAAEVREVLEAFDGRVLLIRSPGSRRGARVMLATSTEDGGHATGVDLDDIRALAEADLGEGTPIDGPLVLVCAHGRRDACCARLGVPVHDALRDTLPAGALWQSSHQGGHRFAANVLVLPWGVQLGRVEPDDAHRVAAKLAAGRIPLDLYRGRTLYSPAVQGAEVAVRRELGLDRVDDLRLEGSDASTVTFATPRGDAVAAVELRAGPVLPPSCGAEPEPTEVWAARLESIV